MGDLNHRRRWLVMPAAAGLLALVGLVAGAPVAAQVPVPAQTITFDYTGAAQSWTVPADVHQATFDVFGAQGGNQGPLFDGAHGGRAIGTVAVTPGEVVTIMVGGRGVDASSVSCGLDDGEGGFNGGGDGGNVGTGCSGPGGGGASDVRRGGSALADRVVVAGGGGGAAGDFSCSDAGGGGGLTGQPSSCDPSSGGNQDGTTGSGLLGQGSDGAVGIGTDSGGGGGGGFYGGAGGLAAYGGGGGSGFGPAGFAIFETGVRPGDGVITISFGASPLVTGVQPNIGPTQGGVATVITGTNFVPGATEVIFGDLGVFVPPDCVSSTECRVVSPPALLGAGPVNVVVGANGQWSLDTPADDFTYLGAPTITSVSPTTGPPGTVITIEGTNFFPPPSVTSVQFGTDPAVAATCTSFTRCTVASPPGVGTVDMVVITPTGQSNSTPFTKQPSVTRISPTDGPAAGDTAITITGSGFDTAPGATAVHFGSAAALAVGCATATTCTAVSPPGSGTVSARVTVSGIQSPDTPADDFTYNAPPRTSPTATVARAEVVRGERHVGVGSGFQPGESVSGEQLSTPLSLGTQVADEQGVVRFTWTIRADETLGDHTFAVVGEVSGRATATFRVVARGSPPATLPATGADPSVLAIASLLILVAGAGLRLTARRRTS